MLIDKLNALPDLTYQEKNLLRFINENPEALLEMNIKELAKKSYTSTSTITRFCQKAGLNGFSNLKIIYTNEYQEMIKLNGLLEKEPFNDGTTMNDILNKLPLIYARNIEFYQSIISRNKLVRIVNMIKHAKRVEIYGTGINYYLGQIMVYKLESIGFECHAYDFLNRDRLNYTNAKKKHTVAILLSYTGKNPTILEIASLLKTENYQTLSISSNLDESLCQLTKENIQITDIHSETELKTTLYVNTILFILDIIYCMLVSNESKNYLLIQGK